MRKKIYLAGPDVFRENTSEHFEKLKELCTQYGFEGLSPFDSEAGEDATAQDIFHANVILLHQCDIVIANVEPFRGPSVDDGTAFEIGYAYATEKLIYGYTEYYDESLRLITIGYPEDEDFPLVEDFGLSRNLMICESIKFSGGTIEETFENVLKLL